MIRSVLFEVPTGYRPFVSTICWITLKKARFASFLLVMGISLSIAQKTLTLDQCIDLAYENNLQLHNTRATLQIGIYSQREQAAAARPQIKAGSTINYAPHFNRWGYDPISTDGGLVDAQLSMQQPITSHRVNRLHAQISDIDQHLLELQLVKTQRDLLMSIKQQFVETLRGQSEIRLRNESVIRLTEYLAVVQLQYAGGTGEYNDVIKTKTQLSIGQETLLKTQMALAISKLSLALLIGTAVDTSFELCGALDKMVSAVQFELFKIDTTNNPYIISAKEELDRGTLEFDLKKRGKYPVITLSIGAGYLSSFDRLTSNESKTTFGFSVGANVEIPLIDWGILHNQRLRQQLIIDTLRTAARIQMQSLRSEYYTLKIKITNTITLLESMKSRVKYAEEDYLLTKSKYSTGASSSADLLLAQQSYTEALLDELQTKVDLLTLANNFEQLSDQRQEGEKRMKAEGRRVNNLELE